MDIDQPEYSFPYSDKKFLSLIAPGHTVSLAPGVHYQPIFAQLDFLQLNFNLFSLFYTKTTHI